MRAARAGAAPPEEARGPSAGEGQTGALLPSPAGPTLLFQHGGPVQAPQACYGSRSRPARPSSGRLVLASGGSRRTTLSSTRGQGRAAALLGPGARRSPDPPQSAGRRPRAQPRGGGSRCLASPAAPPALGRRAGAASKQLNRWGQERAPALACCGPSADTVRVRVQAAGRLEACLLGQQTLEGLAQQQHCCARPE